MLSSETGQRDVSRMSAPVAWTTSKNIGAFHFKNL